MTATAARIDTAMVLAAGFGTRMAPLTDTLPKALVPLCGKPLMDWAMERLETAGARRFVVNTHYLAEQVAAHLSGRADVTLVHEPEILETGGGVMNALPALGDGPFFVVNADSVWLDGVRPAIPRLAEGWNPARMDGLLLMTPTVGAYGYGGLGDFYLDSWGRAERRREGAVAPYLFAGVQVLTKAAFTGLPAGKFSLNRVYDRLEQAGRLYGLVHDGEWYHIGTPEMLETAEAVIAAGHSRANTR